MATVQRVFDALDTDTFLDGGSAATVNDTGTFSEYVLLDQWEGAHCWVQGDMSGSTDDLLIEVLSNPAGGGGGTLDNIPLFSFTVSNAPGEKRASFVVTSVYSFAIKFSSSGTTDTIAVLFKHRRWRWETA